MAYQVSIGGDESGGGGGAGGGGGGGGGRGGGGACRLMSADVFFWPRHLRRVRTESFAGARMF